MSKLGGIRRVCMALTPETRLGSYEILSALGGRRDEVYRARDTKLKRDVALKVLPDLFTADPDRLARFQREAEVLASLNHQNIGAIYGFEDSGAARFPVMELVECGTLADRLARPKGQPSDATVLNQAANAAVKTKGSIFELVYRRLVPHLGHAQAIGAIAHRLCRLIWKILHQGVSYEERGPAVTKHRAQRRAAKMIRELRNLGYRVEPYSLHRAVQHACESFSTLAEELKQRVPR